MSFQQVFLVTALSALCDGRCKKTGLMFRAVFCHQFVSFHFALGPDANNAAGCVDC
jgi:hypothetical protein